MSIKNSIRDFLITGTFAIGPDGQKEPSDWRIYALQLEEIVKGSLHLEEIVKSVSGKKPVISPEEGVYRGYNLAKNEMRKLDEKAEPTNEEFYYIQNGFVGNAISWWREGGAGYVTALDQAGKFSRKEALRISNNREQDKPWLGSYIDAQKKAHKVIVDAQYLDHSFQGVNYPETEN